MTTRGGSPDPDALLGPAATGEAVARRTRFKIFFGFAPGVGKTYRMLQAARDLVAEGVDVVVGAVETHGRYDTASLLLGLEVLPRRRLPHGGGVTEELDLDAALARRPRVLLLDELAHANAPGSRHARRWQDVEELLEAGVEVYTTLSVQDVEGLTDVVAQITQLQARETVPDAVLDRADEVELVDLAPERLLQRVSEGKVDLGEQPEAAREHVFKPGNLLALRELALRRMAERVDADVLAWREAHGSDGTWHAGERVLVCVGPAPDSARLVRAGRRMAAGLRAPWVVAAVEATGRPPLGAADRERLEAHLRLAESLGAEVIRLTGLTVARAILEHARKARVTRIVLGKPRHSRWRDLLGGSLVDEVIRGSGDIEVNVISGDPDAARPPPARRPRGERPWVEAARAVLVMAATTVAAVAATRTLHVPDVEMLFLLGVMLTALTSGRRAALLAAGLGVVAYDFFFVPPDFTLTVADARYLLTFAMMFGVSVVIGTLTLRLRDQQQAAVERERRTAVLLGLSRELSAAVDAAGVAAAVERAASEAVGAEAVLLRAGPDGLLPAGGAGPALVASEGERAAAQWVVEHGRPAGRGTDTLPGEAVLCIPARSFAEVQAVLVVRSREADGPPAEARTLLDALARQAAVALDRVRLAEDARRAALRVETEELRSGLLSSVSHDLRTPLATITGAATALVEDPGLGAETRRDLTQSIVEEAERLERLVANLLDMTRLDRGAVVPRREWVPAEEVVGSALTRLERRLAGRTVRTALPPDLPLLSVDPVLLEQLFLNLLENAIKYTPAGSEIEVSARSQGGTLLFEVGDRGPGIAPGDEERIFDRFYRGEQAGSRGVGLGLPIARAIALVHGGRLSAQNRPGGGALFTLALPAPRERPVAPEAPEAPGTAPPAGGGDP